MFPATLHDSWNPFLAEQAAKPYFHTLAKFLKEERRDHLVFPAEEDVFHAFGLAMHEVKVVILGQDPYHGDGQAHGLSFSVKPGVKLPPSLRNIFKELQSDLGITPAVHGCLEAWARQGVLLLNTVLTVRAHEPLSHRKKGWEQFTTDVIQCVNKLPHVAFVLWGSAAQEKAALLDDRHLVVQSAHPSPLSARRGFFGSQPFSKINTYLSQKGLREIQWRLK